MCVCVNHSIMSDSVTPRIGTLQALPSMEFPRQEYWSGLPFPSPGDLPGSGIEPGSPALQADSLPTELSGKPPQIRLYFIDLSYLWVLSRSSVSPDSL